MSKRLRIFGGPNGSGKTTLYRVPKDKICSRYTRSLENLYDAIMLSDRSFLFDNSSDAHQWIAETEGKRLKIISEQIPQWFQKFVLDKIM